MKRATLAAAAIAMIAAMAPIASPKDSPGDDVLGLEMRRGDESPIAEAAARGPARAYRDHVTPLWIDADRFFYRNDLPGGGREFVMVDSAKGLRQPAFDHAAAAKAIGDALKRHIEPDHLPIDELRWDGKSDAVTLVGREGSWTWNPRDKSMKAANAKPAELPPLERERASRNGGEPAVITFENSGKEALDIYWVDGQGARKKYTTIGPGSAWECSTFAGHVWAVVSRDGRALAFYEAGAEHGHVTLTGAPARPAPGPNRAPAAAQRDRRTSPDGKSTALVRRGNLFIRDAATGEEVQLSDDGKPGDAYEENVSWSPDSTRLAALRVEAAQEHKVYEVESSPADQVQPKLRTLDYLKPGDKIVHPRVRLFDVPARRRIAVDDALFPNPWSITDVRWFADSSQFTFVYNQRGHQALRVVSVDAKTGAARAVVDEASKTFIDYSGKYYCRWIGDREILWMSERDGFNHLWLVDAATGRTKNVVTPGGWVVQNVVDVDDGARRVWVDAGGVVDGQDPYYTQLVRVGFDGAGATPLTQGDGTHTVQWSPGKKWIIDTCSRVDAPPVTVLREASSGKLVCELERADAADALASRGGRWPMRFDAPGRDGKTRICGVAWLPRDFDGAKKYPVLENIYAGPQGFFTPKAFAAQWGERQRLADLGMIVVQCDGMGTSGRSKAFHDVCWKNLKDAGFDDRIAWIRAAAKAVPQMDLSRVGIYGGSAGGQNAMAALIWHHDFYKAAFADCGCHDNRMDKIWWNEQWMGWPVDESYAASSNAVNASKMEGKLMLMVGELDSNVDPASTMQVVSALQKANKDFELVVVAGANHGAAETPYGTRRREKFLAEALRAGR